MVILNTVLGSWGFEPVRVSIFQGKPLCNSVLSRKGKTLAFGRDRWGSMIVALKG